jgi:hypothetical protein
VRMPSLKIIARSRIPGPIHCLYAGCRRRAGKRTPVKDFVRPAPWANFVTLLAADASLSQLVHTKSDSLDRPNYGHADAVPRTSRRAWWKLLHEGLSSTRTIWFHQNQAAFRGGGFTALCSVEKWLKVDEFDALIFTAAEYNRGPTALMYDAMI